jgi:hypothetical protein
VTYGPINRAPENYWTESKVARLADAAIQALLDCGEISPDETVALEGEQERRDSEAQDRRAETKAWQQRVGL